MNNFQQTLSILFLIFGYCILETLSVSVWQDITLNQREKSALDKFRVLMNDSLPHDYMRKDIYLIKWLRVKELNIPEAERTLKQHLKWRKENEMDSIIEEDFGLIEFEYSYTTDGTDFEGRPVLAVNAADWDIRRALITGRKELVTRWALRAYEIGSKRIRELQDQGQNVTQFVMLCNFDGFNIVQHVCPDCVSLLVNFLSTYEFHYPGMADKILAIKTPATFQILLRALRTVMSKDTQDAMRIWGTNPNEWQKNVLEVVPENQLDPEFGGTREPSF